MSNEIITKHGLDFESAPGKIGPHPVFRVGTCHGQYWSLKDSYYILSIINNEPRNGHFDDVLEWFEHSCKRDNKNLLILECMNDKFYLHLISKRGFKPLDADGENCIKIFNQKAYKKLLRNGNEIINKDTLTCI